MNPDDDPFVVRWCRGKMVRYIPILSRLRMKDWLRMVIAWAFLAVEGMMRIALWLFPWPGMLDYSRHRWLKGTWPRLLRGFKDDASPEYAFMDMERMVRSRGYPFEEHMVITEDGYVLVLHRIPHGAVPQGEANKEEALDSPVDIRGAAREGPGMRRRRRCRTMPTIPKGVNMWQDMFPLSGDDTPVDDGGETPPPVPFYADERLTNAFKKSMPIAVTGRRPPILLMHGFMMCSDVWCAMPDAGLCLPFFLADLGYDVWLGNARGNKYSSKHRSYGAGDGRFWDFSMDELAQIDLPTMIHYILELTQFPSLSYIGFSQGTAIGFAAFSSNPKLRERVHLFIALAATTRPRGLDNGIVSTLIRSSPEVIYLIFGRGCMLAITLFWRDALSTAAFTRVLDNAMSFLFGWSCNRLAHKDVVYPHLYSYTSVKQAVHWFQIYQSRRFQMYDDARFLRRGPATGGHIPPKYPLQQLSDTPMAIFWGDRDFLTDIDSTLSQLPRAGVVLMKRIEGYEHLDFLWAGDVHEQVWPSIRTLLAKHTPIDKGKINGSTPFLSATSLTDMPMVH